VPLFSVVTVGLGVGGHVLGGGSPPDAATLTLLIGVVGLAWRVLARAEQSLPRLIVAVYAVQAGMHIALLSPATGSVSMSGMTIGAVSVPPGAMWAGHLLAGLGVAAWLRRGERLFWRLVRRTGQRLLAPRPTPMALQRPATTPPQRRPGPSLVGARPVLCDPLRGPPR